MLTLNLNASNNNTRIKTLGDELAAGRIAGFLDVL